MAFSEKQQISELLKRSERPLIVLPETADVDHFTAAFGLTKVLKKLDKVATIATAALPPKAVLAFSKDHTIENDIPNLHDLMIEVDIGSTEPDELHYEVVDGRLRIHISPKSGMWKQDQVNVKPSNYKHDLVMCIGAQDLEACGRLFENYADFFYRTPIINIDHSPANEHFGQINVVNITATACGEVCHELVELIDPVLIDEDIATHFMTGMMAKTKSFKSRNVTPKTLRAASELLQKGARRDEIVRHLYRTRSVETLRLWGRALARLKSQTEKNLVWTILSKQDFMHAGADEEDLPEVIEELIQSSPKAEMVLLLYETRQGDICGIMRVQPPYDAKQLTEPFKGSGGKEEARFTIKNTDLVKAERQVIQTIEKRA